jgi:hypothetical protein
MKRSAPDVLLDPPQPARPDFARYATLLRLIAGFFALRVAGQAIQYWIALDAPAVPGGRGGFTLSLCGERDDALA